MAMGPEPDSSRSAASASAVEVWTSGGIPSRGSVSSSVLDSGWGSVTCSRYGQVRWSCHCPAGSATVIHPNVGLLPHSCLPISRTPVVAAATVRATSHSPLRDAGAPACQDGRVRTAAATSAEAKPASTSSFLAACRGEEPDRVPVWFMRQAGRSLPEYREARAGTTMLEACRTPDLVCAITMQPVRRYDTDAAIFFSDIVVPLAAIGIAIDIVPGVGPVVAEPSRTEADVDRLRNLDPCDVGYITEAVGLLTAELGDIPLIGFAGAPFTLASYLIEGGPSKDHAKTRALMRSRPDVWHALASKLAAICGEFLRVQVEAGASAVQL